MKLSTAHTLTHKRWHIISAIVVMASFLVLVSIALGQDDAQNSPEITTNQSTTTSEPIKNISNDDDLETAKQQVNENNLNFMDDSELKQIEVELL